MAVDSPNPTLFVLDEFDVGSLDSESLYSEILSWSDRKLTRFGRALSSTLTYDGGSAIEPSIFDFFASSLLRGASSCCAPNCQAEVLDVLARFSALYADRVFVPVGSAHSKEWDYDDVLNLCQTVNRIVRLRPLVDSGIVRLVGDSANCICPTCLASRGVDLRRLEREATAFWRSVSDRFELIIRPDAEDPVRKSTAQRTTFRTL